MTHPSRPMLALLISMVGCGQDISLTKSTAELIITPDFSDAYTVPVGTTVELPVSLFAVDGDVEVLNIQTSNIEATFFSLTAEDSFKVKSGEEVVLSFVYTPTEEGLHFAEVAVTTDEKGGGDHNIELRGEAALAGLSYFPPLLDFGPVAVGGISERSLTVTNTGQIAVDELNLTTTDSTFVVNPASTAIEAGETVELTITFTAISEDIVRAEASGDAGAVGGFGPVTLLANACAEGDPSQYDADGDGTSVCGTDCDDTRADVHPGATEVCDTVDQDCDGIIDEETACYDDDGDGVTESDGDCNDGDAGVFPGNPEDMTNGIDDDCDGVVDSGTEDGDYDGYGLMGGDCDDDDASAYPGAPETPDGVDDDCDGTVDDTTVAYDDDGDGYSEDGGDCDDDSTAVYPSAPESADWIDNDCDGTVDEGTTAYDDDGDGFTEVGGDCDDSTGTVNPAETEVSGNGIDEDCNSTTGT